MSDSGNVCKDWTNLWESQGHPHCSLRPIERNFNFGTYGFPRSNLQQNGSSGESFRKMFSRSGLYGNIVQTTDNFRVQCRAVRTTVSTKFTNYAGAWTQPNTVANSSTNRNQSTATESSKFEEKALRICAIPNRCWNTPHGHTESTKPQNIFRAIIIRFIYIQFQWNWIECKFPA